MRRVISVGLLLMVMAGLAAAAAPAVWRLTSAKIMAPAEGLDVRYPQLAGGEATARSFANALLKARADSFVSEFRRDAVELNDTDFQTLGPQAKNSLLVRFTSDYLQKGIFSGAFTQEQYFAGSAHPSHLVVGVNFDLIRKREIALADLFLPQSDHLKTLSEYCIREIRRRQEKNGGEPYDGENWTGAAPEAANYSVFRINKDGLIIVFNEYQVDCYAAGVYEIKVPWKVLKDSLDPAGPAAIFRK